MSAALFFALAVGIPAVLLHHYARWPRVNLALFALAAAAATAAFPAFPEALAGLTATAKDARILGIWTIILLALFLLEVLPHPGVMGARLRNAQARLTKGGRARPVVSQRRQRRYERVVKPAIAILFGASAILVWGDRSRLLSNTGQSVRQTGSVASSITASIQSGRAAAMVPAAERVSVAVIGVAVVAAVIAALIHHERRRLRREGHLPVKGGKGGGGGPGMPAMRGAPQGRPPIETGTRG